MLTEHHVFLATHQPCSRYRQSDYREDDEELEVLKAVGSRNLKLDSTARNILRSDAAKV